MQRELLAMEEKMRLMKEKLQKKNKHSEMSEIMTRKSPKAKTTKLVELDMFSKSPPPSSSRALSSPVKTNPLTEAERANAKTAKYEPTTTNWCPSRIKQVSERVLGQDEARDRLAAADKEKKEMARIVRQDLDMDGSSDDQDEDGNDRYNECGKEIKKRLALASKTVGSSSSEGVVPPRAAVVSTKVGK